MPGTELAVRGLQRDFARPTAAAGLMWLIAARAEQGFCSVFVSTLARRFKISWSQRDDETWVTTYHAVTKAILSLI